MDVWSRDPQLPGNADEKSRTDCIPFLSFLTQLPSCLPQRACSPFIPV